MLNHPRSGEGIVITVNGIRTAKPAAFHPARDASLTKVELHVLRLRMPDSMMARNIAALTAETTDNLGPIL